MGGTAVGTGLNIPENFSNIAIREVRAITVQDFVIAGNSFEATQAAEAILVIGLRFSFPCEFFGFKPRAIFMATSGFNAK